MDNRTVPAPNPTVTAPNSNPTVTATPTPNEPPITTLHIHWENRGYVNVRHVNNEQDAQCVRQAK